MLVKMQDSMPPECFATVDDLCRDWIAQIVYELDGPGFELYGAHGYEPERIENQARSGFIPYTDGGWIAMVPGVISSDAGRGDHAGLLSAEVERLEQDAREAWIADNPDRGDPWEDDLDDETREEWFEYENDWMQSVYFVDIRAIYYTAENRRNISGKPEVYFVASVNFDECGRDKHSITLWDCNVLIAEVTPAKLDAMRADAIDAIARMEAKPIK